jgi:hypothetical protein
VNNQVNKLIVGDVAMAALVVSTRRLAGCRRISAAIMASAVLVLWSSGAMAATKSCLGATGASVTTTDPKLFNLQCMQQIQIPGKPLQTFGGSTFLRTTSTTASYLLADRSNLGVDVINGTNLAFSKLLTAKDAVGGFLGQLIWSNGPATTNTARPGTSDESHSGPNGLAVYINAADTTHIGRWLYVADGGCNTDINAASYANPAAAGTMGACGTPADASTVPNPLYTHANCINPGAATLPTSTVCYPNQHQPNVKLFDLKSNTWVASARRRRQRPAPAKLRRRLAPLRSAIMHPTPISKATSVPPRPVRLRSGWIRMTAMSTSWSPAPTSRSSETAPEAWERRPRAPRAARGAAIPGPSHPTKNSRLARQLRRGRPRILI